MLLSIYRTSRRGYLIYKYIIIFFFKKNEGIYLISIRYLLVVNLLSMWKNCTDKLIKFIYHLYNLYPLLYN